ncbi:cupin domain-containing protein [Roseomonas sp. E05]|uniref:cupin domain-containing protein n=1 Tax=Roseomonas sp. E05 TaxID=3046310 RepID=UPI0024BBBCAE|nr:cupin domain-containing protein [Roseomonas sp. E05]MDJ0389910.1 cupin domain-containing protein [Roseomonas sp. E05]
MRSENVWLTNQPDAPNNPRLPVRLYRSAVPAGEPAAAEALFASHGWPPAWRNGIFPYVHFHTTAHEALAIVSGRVRVRLGGEAGQDFELEAGDVVMLPAGTGHQCLEASEDLLVVGAYPAGQQPDQHRGVVGQVAELRARIARLPDPPACPVSGEAVPRRP